MTEDIQIAFSTKSRYLLSNRMKDLNWSSQLQAANKKLSKVVASSFSLLGCFGRFRIEFKTTQHFPEKKFSAKIVICGTSTVVCVEFVRMLSRDWEWFFLRRIFRELFLLFSGTRSWSLLHCRASETSLNSYLTLMTPDLLAFWPLSKKLEGFFHEG